MGISANLYNCYGNRTKRPLKLEELNNNLVVISLQSTDPNFKAIELVRAFFIKFHRSPYIYLEETFARV